MKTNYVALHEAGVAHALAVVPATNDWYPCGFAWSRTKGNTAFGRAMLAAGIYRRSHYYGGAEFTWSRATMSQSLDYKESLAAAYRDYLREHGIEVGIRTNID